jgi:hypothetical protein
MQFVPPFILLQFNPCLYIIEERLTFIIHFRATKKEKRRKKKREEKRKEKKKEKRKEKKKGKGKRMSLSFIFLP